MRFGGRVLALAFAERFIMLRAIVFFIFDLRTGSIHNYFNSNVISGLFGQCYFFIH